MKSRFRPVIFGAGAIALAMLAAGCATAPTGGDDALARQIEAARTPAEHEAVAQEFDRQAARAREQAEQHRAMPRHCEQLIRNAEDDARIYAEMAEQHRQWAKQPPGPDNELEER